LRIPILLEVRGKANALREVAKELRGLGLSISTTQSGLRRLFVEEDSKQGTTLVNVFI
jgi:hypothetical protein